MSESWKNVNVGFTLFARIAAHGTPVKHNRHSPIPGTISAGLGGGAVANKELPGGGLELHARVF